MKPIYLAPLQSYTNVHHRRAHHQSVGGIAKYFTPFFEEGKTGFSVPALLPELATDWNEGCRLVPQLATANGSFLVAFAREVNKLGYREININMGCPFPMLVKRHKGGGMLGVPGQVDKMLDDFFKANLPLRLSVKTRLGISNNEEGLTLAKVLNNYPLEEVILHPRLVVQKYGGEPDWEAYGVFADVMKHRMVANGDIVSKMQIEELETRFPGIGACMIGRGLLADPFMLDTDMDTTQKIRRMKAFHQCFFDDVVRICMDWNQAFGKLETFWFYPLASSIEGKRHWRKLKKHNRPELYRKWLEDVWPLLYPSLKNVD